MLSQKKALYKLILFETCICIFRILENFSCLTGCLCIILKESLNILCGDMERVTGNGKDLSERLNCCCYIIIHLW